MESSIWCLGNQDDITLAMLNPDADIPVNVIMRDWVKEHGDVPIFSQGEISGHLTIDPKGYLVYRTVDHGDFLVSQWIDPRGEHHLRAEMANFEETLAEQALRNSKNKHPQSTEVP